MNAFPEPSLENLIAWLRGYWPGSERDRIDADTRLEADLGMTGMDGDDFLRDVQKHFGISLLDADGGYREAFGLKEGEWLFHLESAGCLLPWWPQKQTVYSLTVGEVLDALLRRAKTDVSVSSFE